MYMVAHVALSCLPNFTFDVLLSVDIFRNASTIDAKQMLGIHPNMKERNECNGYRIGKQRENHQKTRHSTEQNSTKLPPKDLRHGVKGSLPSQVFVFFFPDNESGAR